MIFNDRKAKHVTEDPHPGSCLLRDDKDAEVDWGTSPPLDLKHLQRQIHYGSTSGIKDGVEGIRGWVLALVADLWDSFPIGSKANTVIIRGR